MKKEKAFRIFFFLSGGLIYLSELLANISISQLRQKFIVHFLIFTFLDPKKNKRSFLFRFGWYQFFFEEGS